MHPLRLAAALPIGALALTLAAAPAMAAPGHHQDGRRGGDWQGDHHGPRGGRRGPEEARQPGTVSVTGHGESTAAPDMAVVTLGVTVQAPSAAEAMRQNTERQQVVIDTLRGRGIEGRDIQTSGLSLSPVQDYSREGQPPRITGYQASNMVTVRVRDLPRLGEALDALVGAGANEINGIGFQRENLEDAENEARARAVENARLRAEVMANAAGMEVGRLLAITDVAARMGPQPMMRAMAMDSAAAAAPVPVEAGELSVAAEVTVTWELRPARGGQGRLGPDARGGYGGGAPGMGQSGMHGMGHVHGHDGMAAPGQPMPDQGGMGMMPHQGGAAPAQPPVAAPAGDAAAPGIAPPAEPAAGATAAPAPTTPAAAPADAGGATPPSVPAPGDGGTPAPAN